MWISFYQPHWLGSRDGEDIAPAFQTLSEWAVYLHRAVVGIVNNEFLALVYANQLADEYSNLYFRAWFCRSSKWYSP